VKTASILSGKQKRHLRAIAHNLDPVVQLGKQGLTHGAERAIDEALERHELVKVKLLTECPEDKTELAERLGPRLAATVAQTLGRTILLYRKHPKKPVIVLPKD
jgi:RNA-binding protein